MTEREKFDVQIVCPRCGAKGRMQGSEGQNPVEAILDQSVESVSQGFRIDGDTIVCENCGTKAHPN